MHGQQNIKAVSNLAYTKHKWQLSRPNGYKTDHLQSHASYIISVGLLLVQCY
jgi:hypothetical protein